MVEKAVRRHLGLSKRLLATAAILWLGSAVSNLKAATLGSQIVGQVQGVWSSPPEGLPTWAMPNGAYLGNGDLGVVVGGAADNLRFYIGKSDFFGVVRGYIMPAGSLQIAIPQLQHVSRYRLEQNPGPATVTGQFSGHTGESLRMKSWIARSPDILAVELHNTGTRPLTVTSPLLNAWGTSNANLSSCTARLATMPVSPDSVLAYAGNRVAGGRPAGFAGDIKYIVIGQMANHSEADRDVPLYGWRWRAGRLLRDSAAASDAKGDGTFATFHGTAHDYLRLGVIRMPQRGFVFSALVRCNRQQSRAFIFSATLNPHPPRRYPYHRGFAVGLSHGRIYAQLNRTAIEASTPLPLARWVKITVKYDVKHLQLWIGQQLVAQTIHMQSTAMTTWNYRVTNVNIAPKSLALTGVSVGHHVWRRTLVGANVFHGRVGYVWFQRLLPSTVKPGDILHFGSVNDNATVYINGHKVITHNGYNTPFSLPLAGLIRSGRSNVVTVLDQNLGGAGGIMGLVTVEDKGADGVAGPTAPMTVNPQLHPWLPEASAVMGKDKGAIHTGESGIPFDGCSPKGLMALRVLGVQCHTKLHAIAFSLAPGAKATIVLAIATNRLTRGGELVARREITSITQQRLGMLWQQHLAWWNKFWNRSSITLPWKDIEGEWYGSLYDLACCSRRGYNPPGLWGNFITRRSVGWQGDYTLDYNHEATFWGCFPANHLALVDNYATPMLENMPRARAIAKGLGYHGLYGYTHLIPTPGWDDDSSHFLSQKAAWLFGTVDCVMYWKYTCNKAWAAHVWPYLRGVAAFWDHYLVMRNGKYVDFNDAPDEWDDGSSIDPATTIAFLHLLYPNMIQMSRVLHHSAATRQRWTYIFSHLPGLPIVPADSIKALVKAVGRQVLRGRMVIRQSLSGPAWINVGNRLGGHPPVAMSGSSAGMNSGQCIFPGWYVGMESSPALRAAALNTLELQQTWYDFNNTSTFYPACACAGYNPRIIVAHLHRMIAHFTRPNFGYMFGGGGVENFSTVPATISNMLLQSYQRNIHLFADWSRHWNVQFHRLLACGDFAISASLQNGHVMWLTVRCQSGGTLRLINPWRRHAARLVAPKRKFPPDALIVLPTIPGQVLRFLPAAAGK
jgi:hypothetical protein